MSVLLPKKLDKSKILNQVVDSSFHFENGLQTSSPWKTNKNARRATVCPEVQKSQKNVKNARKSLPADKAPKIKLDGPLKRRKKSAKQIEKAEQEYAFFDSSQDEGENEAKQVKLVVSEELSSGASGSKNSSTPAAVSKAKSRARQVKTKTPSKKLLHDSDKNSPRPSSPTKRKQKEPESPLKKVKASLKKISHSKTPVKKAKNTPKKTPSKTVMVRKTPAKQTPAKKPPAKKTSAKKTPAENVPDKKTLAKKISAQTVPTKKTPAATKKPAKEFAIGLRKSTRLGK